MSFADHHHCLALSNLFNQRASRPVAAGQVLYTTEDPSNSVDFLRAGLVRTSVISEKGKELFLELVNRDEQVLIETLCE